LHRSTYILTSWCVDYLLTGLLTILLKNIGKPILSVKVLPIPISKIKNKILIIIIITRKFIMRTQSSIKHKSEARAVTRWPGGVC